MSPQEWTIKVTALRQQLEDVRQRDKFGYEPRIPENMLLLENLQQAFEELQVAEEELRQQNEELAVTTAALDVERWRYQELFEFAPDAYFVTTLTGNIQEANFAAAELFNVPRHYLLGKPLILFVPEEDREMFRNQLRQLYVLKTTKTWEIRLQPRESALFDTQLSVSAARNASTEKAVGLRWVMRDITARKAMEKQLHALNVMLEKRVEERTTELKRSNHDLEQFAYIASHDLQEPLRTLSTYTQLLAHHYEGTLDVEVDEFIHFIVDNSSRMQELIKDLLNYSRVGQKDEEATEISSEALWEQTVYLFEESIAESGAIITHDPLPMVFANATLLGQVLQNLLSNALKFRGQEPPRIHISAERKDENWLFAVRDNGIGIDPRFSERIFAIFQRLHPRTTYSGTGIGLAICKKVIEHYGGKIWMESTPGQGATFYFTIPTRG